MKLRLIFLCALALIAVPAMALEGDQGDPRAESDFMFSRIDSNNDKLVSRAEFDAYSAARWKGADTNSDGNLTADELAGERRQLHEEFRMLKEKPAQ